MLRWFRRFIRRREDYWNRVDAARVGRVRLWTGELVDRFVIGRPMCGSRVPARASDARRRPGTRAGLDARGAQPLEVLVGGFSSLEAIAAALVVHATQDVVQAVGLGRRPAEHVADDVCVRAVEDSRLAPGPFGRLRVPETRRKPSPLTALLLSCHRSPSLVLARRGRRPRREPAGRTTRARP